LEAARQKRLERKEARASKFISNIKKKTTERAYGQGFDTAKPMADMSNINASKKKKKK
jgi:phage gp37-like protein